MTGKTMREALDISAYLVVGPENTEGRPVREIVRAALHAGFTCVQIRSKEAGAREMIELLREAAEEIAAAGASDRVALLADDRLDVVLAARKMGIKADGVHVGQSDVPPEICRAYLGEEAVVGLSARTDELIAYVREADTGAVDYFGAGPLHETATKPDCGLDAEGNIITRSFEEIAEIARASKIPVVVGGGVKLADIPSLAQTGVDGFFVVSAVAGAPDPEKAAAELVKAWRENARKS